MSIKEESEHKWKNRWVTVLIILIFTGASIISTNQYHYGILDHSIVIPFLKSSLSHNLYPDDLLLTQKPFYYTYLWSLCALLIKIFNIPIPLLFFAGYCASLFFIFLGTYLIGKLLFGKREVAFLSLFFLLFNIKTFAGGITLDNIFLARDAALPLLIFSVYFFLKEKYLYSSLLQGIGFLIHPMTAAYFIIMQGATLLFSVKYVGIKKIAGYSLVLLIASSPILIWRYLYHPPSMNFINAGTQWLELLRLRSSHHFFPFSWTKDVTIRAALLLCLFFITWKHKPQVYHQRMIEIFVVAILVMCLAGVIFSEWIPVSIILNFQLLRSFTFIYFIVAIYYSNFFVTEFFIRRNIFYVLIITLLSLGILYGASGWKYAAITFFIFLLCLTIYRAVAGKEQLPAKYFISILLLTVAAISSVIYMRHRDFTINNIQEKQWLNMQMWVKGNTISNTVFIVPPYLEGFRVESERTVYADWKDGTLLNFNPAFGLEWLRRMEKLGYEKNSSLQDGFKGLREKNFLHVAEEISAVHSVLLVIEKDGATLNFPKLYENEKFIVYKIH